MTFIKIENIVINTKYIVAVQLENKTRSGEKCVSLLIANPNFSLANACQYEQIDFTGMQAVVLQDYFSSFNNVIELMPQPQKQPTSQ